MYSCKSVIQGFIRKKGLIAKYLDWGRYLLQTYTVAIKLLRNSAWQTFSDQVLDIIVKVFITSRRLLFAVRVGIKV
jgi:hypothetical protein